MMEICNRKCGYNESIGEKSTDQLRDYRLRLFTLMINVYKITQKDNVSKWLFEWRKKSFAKYNTLEKTVHSTKFETTKMKLIL